MARIADQSTPTTRRAWLVKKMLWQESKLERRRLELPASSWSIPSITALILAAALVVALA